MRLSSVLYAERCESSGFAIRSSLRALLIRARESAGGASVPRGNLPTVEATDDLLLAALRAAHDEATFLVLYLAAAGYAL